MSLAPGSRIGIYEVSTLVGEGGMGAVYRATDTALKRQVALKILPDEFSTDADRLARFQREAEVLASLNHPRIAAIYGLERSAGLTALVMELVEGEDLAARIGRGPIPVADALPIARQIAEALEAAHEQGIIHRDLKPANIKLRNDGSVKVLDFGLAKAVDNGATAGAPATAPGRALAATVTSPAMTMHGVILGTAAYMSPEQAKGRPVDQRTDVFAFGCVLYEMLTGQRAFDGDDVTEVLGAVVRLEPDWARLPADTPPALRRLLRLCLEKNLKNRRGTATDIRLDLESALAEPDAAPIGLRSNGQSLLSRLLWPAVAVVFTTMSAILALLYFRATSVERPPLMQFEISAPTGGRFTGRQPGLQMAVSPDGTKVVFGVDTQGQTSRLWLRALSELDPQPLPGTEFGQSAFWSPDSRSVGFFAQKELKRIDIVGGIVRTVCECDAYGGSTWATNGLIVFGGKEGLYRIAADGGVAAAITRVDSTRGETAHVQPQFLPDGRLLFVILSSKPDAAGLYVTSLEGTRTPRVLAISSKAEFAAPDRLLWVQNGTLLAQRFDVGSVALVGEPSRLKEEISENTTTNGRASFSISQTGVLVTGASDALRSPELTLDWYDRTGKQLSHVLNGTPLGMSLSPDGKRLAMHRHDDASGGGDIGVLDLERGATTRFTFDIAEEASSPIWSPDGRSIAFGALRQGKWGLYRKPADLSGPEEVLFESEVIKIPAAWAPDGRSLVFVTYENTGSDLWILPLSGDRKPIGYAHSPFWETFPAFSPDGRWLVYRRSTQNGPGAGEIYVESYPVPGVKFQPSTGRATQPQWRSDGKELFYIDSVDAALFSISVDHAGNTLKFGTPQLLFDAQRSGSAHLPTGTSHYTFVPSLNGQQFLIRRNQDQSVAPRQALTVTLNWPSLLTP